ncbi:MAG: hypothetical protein GTO41_00205, partial [Burkholderiales bacterium]|nr:hypothetical protein [Burkholderiales bacterium]
PTNHQRVLYATLLFAYEYDSNVGSFPEFVGLGAIDDKDDSRAVVAFFGDLTLVQRECWNAGLIASALGAFQFDQDEFDFSEFMGGAYTNYAFSEDWFAGLRYEYHDSRIEAEHLAGDHRLVPNITRFIGDWGHITAYYEFNSASSNLPALIPAQIQSGQANAVGFTLAKYTRCGDGRIYFGYRFQDDDADGADFVRQFHMVTARIEQPLCNNWIADAEVRY